MCTLTQLKQRYIYLIMLMEGDLVVESVYTSGIIKDYDCLESTYLITKPACINCTKITEA